MAALVVLGVIALAAGITAIGISLPERAWDRAMLRLSSRLSPEAIPQSTGVPPVNTVTKQIGAAPGEVARHQPVAAQPPAPPATSLLDWLIDAIIEGLRKLIGSRGFPRRALRILGAILIVVAMLCFLLGSVGQGHSQGEEDGGASQHVTAPTYY